MAETENSKLKLKIIMAALEVDTQTLADETGEQRPVLSGIVNGSARKAVKARRRFADALCRKVSDLIMPTADAPEPEKVV